MKLHVTLLLVAVALTGCDRADMAGTTRTTNATVDVPADNTGTNAHDKSGALTPMNQGNGRDDLDVTQAIRQSMMADDALSFDAKNVKIITNDGVITLRGAVRSDDERRSIESKALAVAGTHRVDNQLEVAP